MHKVMHKVRAQSTLKVRKVLRTLSPLRSSRESVHCVQCADRGLERDRDHHPRDPLNRSEPRLRYCADSRARARDAEAPQNRTVASARPLDSPFSALFGVATTSTVRAGKGRPPIALAIALAAKRFRRAVLRFRVDSQGIGART